MFFCLKENPHPGGSTSVSVCSFVSSAYSVCEISVPREARKPPHFRRGLGEALYAIISLERRWYLTPLVNSFLRATSGRKSTRQPLIIAEGENSSASMAA